MKKWHLEGYELDLIRGLYQAKAVVAHLENRLAIYRDFRHIIVHNEGFVSDNEGCPHDNKRCSS